MIHKLGWRRDFPDFRDFHINTTDVSDKLVKLGQKKSVKQMLAQVKMAKNKSALPANIDLTQWCSPVENQGQIGSCTAQAGVGLIEYFEMRAFNRHLDASRLFLYKVTRNLMGLTGDTGAYLRTTMGAMRMFGVPPERYWPYIEADFDLEPDAFCYSLAQNFQAISFYRLDKGVYQKDLLHRIKQFLHAGLPSMFGFPVYESMDQAETNGGAIPYPSIHEHELGGHAVMEVGYDDNIVIENKWGNFFTTGAIKIRNSWGKQWGDEGYGWIPYDYILEGLATDWWSLLKNEWVDTNKFGA